MHMFALATIVLELCSTARLYLHYVFHVRARTLSNSSISCLLGIRISWSVSRRRVQPVLLRTNHPFLLRPTFQNHPPAGLDRELFVTSAMTEVGCWSRTVCRCCYWLFSLQVGLFLWREEIHSCLPQWVDLLYKQGFGLMDSHKLNLRQKALGSSIMVSDVGTLDSFVTKKKLRLCLGKPNGWVP